METIQVHERRIRRKEKKALVTQEYKKQFTSLDNRMPTKGTRPYEILSLLKRCKGRGATAWDFINTLELVHYTKPISTLRADGIDILSIREKNSIRNGYHMRYVLKQFYKPKKK